MNFTACSNLLLLQTTYWLLKLLINKKTNTIWINSYASCSTCNAKNLEYISSSSFLNIYPWYSPTRDRHLLAKSLHHWPTWLAELSIYQHVNNPEIITDLGPSEEAARDHACKKKVNTCKHTWSLSKAMMVIMVNTTPKHMTTSTMEVSWIGGPRDKPYSTLQVRNSFIITVYYSFSQSDKIWPLIVVVLESYYLVKTWEKPLN